MMTLLKRLGPGVVLLALFVGAEADAALALTLVHNLTFIPNVAGSGAVVLAPTNTGLAAEFQITGGINGQTYTITLPTGTANMTLAGKNITAGTWTSNPSGSITLSGTTGTFYVGATQGAIAAADGQGTYTSPAQAVKVTWLVTNATATFTASIAVTSAIALTNVSALNLGGGVQGDPAKIVAATSGSAAKFNVTGGDNLQYSITLPTTVTMTTGSGVGAQNQIVVNAFTSSVTSPATLSATGTGTFSVGATRAALLSNQTQGNYTTTFSVTVTYY